MDAPSLEETRMRASQLLSKVRTCTVHTHLMSIYIHMLIKWGSLSSGGPHRLPIPTFPPPPHLFTYLSCPSHPSTSTPTHPHPHTHLPPPPLPLPPQVFLQHLSPLLKLGNFQELWLGILGVLEKYCLIKDSDSLVGGGVGGPLVGVAGHALLIWIISL